MALRPARIYRKWKRPYTRISSKVHAKNYIKGIPGSKLRLFDIGNLKGNFDVSLSLIPKKTSQIRHNALEAARIASNSFLKKNVDETDYHLKIRVYPHHILREHAQAAVAQADRFYQGMSHPFGKPIGVAARVKEGQPIITISVMNQDVKIAKEALRRAGDKMPIACKIIEE